MWNCDTHEELVRKVLDETQLGDNVVLVDMVPPNQQFLLSNRLSLRQLQALDAVSYLSFASPDPAHTLYNYLSFLELEPNPPKIVIHGLCERLSITFSHLLDKSVSSALTEKDFQQFSLKQVLLTLGKIDEMRQAGITIVLNESNEVSELLSRTYMSRGGPKTAISDFKVLNPAQMVSLGSVLERMGE